MSERKSGWAGCQWRLPIATELGLSWRYREAKTMSMGDEELMSLLEEQAPVRDEPLPTLGELFADGSAIDLLRNQQLVLRSQSKEEINLRLLHQGQSYVPALLDGRLEDLLHLPAATAPLESMVGLVAQLSSCLASHVELDEANLLLLAVFISEYLGNRVPALRSRSESLGAAGSGSRSG